MVVGLGVVRERTGQAAGLLSLSKITMLVVFGFLYEKGAAVNHVANNGDNALMCASRRGNAEIVKYLVDAGADPDSRKKSAACHVEAAWKNHGAHGVEILMEKQPSCVHRDTGTLELWSASSPQVRIQTSKIRMGKPPSILRG